jgi:hypothetical protein
MHQIEHFQLATPQPISLKLRAGCVIRVTHGRLWVTRPNHLEDVWLHAGERWMLPDSAAVWLSAEPQAQFQLAHSLTGWRRPLLANWRLRRPMLTPVGMPGQGLARIACSQMQAG